MIHNLSKTNSVFNTFLAEMRDVEIQKDAMRFRRNLERIAEIMAYEVSKELEYESKMVVTPLGEIETTQLKEQPILATILRAGLGMHQGMLNYFDKAQSAFVSAYRKYSNAENYDIYVEYISSPSIQDKVVFITDPMLATGNSMVTVYKALLQKGTPKKIYILAAVAHSDALDYVRRYFPNNTEIWVGSIDTELTAKSYIVPGIGDAGDLAYGLKS
ncbi:MAG: uracil phosphoribosyltransferase [Crocinitomicaceae bacterium]|nr:uracil phosphoribosyltransferase [Crocinitomicaceae bacterium]